MNIFTYNSYKNFTLDWIRAQPKKGRGLLSSIARLLNTNTVTMSQIFRGDRDLSLEQALLVGRYMGLDNLQEEYFLLLVQISRSSTHEFTSYLKKKQDELRKSADDLKQRVPQKVEISEEARGIFYSDWEYSAIRLKSALNEHHHSESISKSLGIPLERTLKIMSFLKRHGFVIEEEGKLSPGILSTHLASDSPFINNHRRNWRVKSFEVMSKNESANLFYSGPMTLSEKAYVKTRSHLVDFIAKLSKEIQETDDEKTACLNIDWFQF